MFPAIHGVAGAAAGGSGTAVKVQNKSGTASTQNNLAVTFDSAPTENNLLVAVGWTTDQAVQNLSIAGWTEAFSLQVTYGSGLDGTVACFYKIAGASESSTVTLASDGPLTPESIGLHAMEWSGMATSTPLDKTATNDETGSNSRVADTGTTAATAQANALAIAACCIADDDFDASPTFSGGYTRDADLSVGAGSADSSMAVGFKILSATGTQTTTCTWTGGGSSEERFSGIAVFKGA